MSRPSSGSPMPVSSLIASVTWIEPMLAQKPSRELYQLAASQALMRLLQRSWPPDRHMSCLN